MPSTPRLLRSGRILALLFVFLSLSFRGAVGQQARRTFVAGEIILYMQRGTPQADVNALAAQVQADSVTPLLLADCYKLTLAAARKTDQDTLNAVTTLKQDARVRWVGPNRLYYPDAAPTSEPGDPRYQSGEQWNLKMINMPQAWYLQKGAANTNVAIIDSGTHLNHEDLTGQYDPGSFDFADNDNNVTADGGGTEPEHGTHTSGIMIARTDNGVGIAGICWQNIKCVMLKDQKAGQANLDGAAILNAYAYVAAQAANLHIVSLNLSFGSFGGDPTDVNDPEYQAIQNIVSAGVIVVASAGNSGGDNSTHLPSAFPFVLSVSAVGPSGTLASYSSFGKVDIAAPGGDISASGNLSDGILSTEGLGYAFEQGTSDAAPHVTAVAALLRSVPGVTPTLAIQALKDGANKAGLGTLPDTRFGYGILDAYNSLLRVSVRAQVVDPEGVDANGRQTDPTGLSLPVQTLNPTLRFQMSNVTPNSVQVKLDGSVIATGPADVLNNLESGTPPQFYTFALRHKLTPGQHTIVISGSNPAGDQTTTDTRTITVTPFVLPAGRSFVSIPFYAAPTDDPPRDESIFGPNYTLNRWVPSSDLAYKYATFPGGVAPPANFATFTPPDTAPMPDIPGATVTPPLGLAWFVDVPAAVTLTTYGKNFPQNAFRIPVQKGWNMVGDPYTVAVPFNTVSVELPNKTRLTIQQAVDQGLLQPFIYRYVNGQYQFRVLPDGAFVPWEGHWVYMNPSGPYDTLTLILSPVTPGSLYTSGLGSRAAARRRSLTTRAASSVTVTADGTPRVSGTGSWAVRLVARAKNLTDSYNFIGMTSRATDGADATKVPKPPLVAPYVALGIQRPDLPAGLYAQDLRPLGGVKTWDVSVSTDQANTDVVLTWPNIQTVPRNYRLVLTDKVTGQTVDMRRQSSYRFNTGSGSTTRALTLTARPTTMGGRPVFTGIFINPTTAGNGRGVSTYEIGYTISQDARVEVSILAANGRTIARVGATRDVTSGDNRVIWNGRDAQGRTIPAGVYSLQLRAITPEGEVTREIRPFLNAGR
ncbi:MAG TPA: S8 family serine peptidase [Chthonomonadaceae bacterium]|nr:S8 family serine peptidase [Chthonomonadaceae bacterium]